ncbi:calcium/sodium antiporter [Sphingosinicella microcystinivorans]|uniref:calcium/sodium antiporter n=1 Tax=Sphingosinicella microcystinivorans TaxID=335406 RepID=UPI0022F3BBE8|nr:calcium/sodium antiporter [Sphingosinicella microcystinivorans]WBX83073.1 calcium/sodium antiporter [Sphingosinicella microcystinivorans]
MLSALLWCIAGIVVLVAGAEVVVRAGAKVAADLGIPPLIVGLTIVAIGTSAPELAVGIEAALQGSGALAVGNIAGTNTLNLLLILGLSALIDPLALRLQTLRLDLPVMVASAFALLAMAWDGVLTRTEGAAMVAGAIVYTAVIVRLSQQESLRVKAEYIAEFGVSPRERSRVETIVNLAGLMVGITIIIIGADWLVDGGVTLARGLQISEALIGLTVVAIGTSMPELVTTIVGTIRKERDIAVGNLLGSSIYNILAILGITCLVPAGGVRFGPELVSVDIPVMALVACICGPVFFTGRRISRLEGLLFVTGYAAYLVYLVTNRT